ncbi:translation initiation factor eIF2B subunit gamma [Ciona intestinalis]
MKIPSMELQAIIMAGGKGSHMGDLTDNTPKALLPVGNKPLIWFPVNMLEKVGFQDVIIVTLNSAKTEVEHCLKNCKIAVKLYGIPDDSETDTVDSLCLIKDDIKSDMLILSCDVITDLPLHKLADVHRLHDSTVSMLFCPSQPLLENLPGVKSKKKAQQKQREFIGMTQVRNFHQRVLFLLNEADLDDELLPVRQALMEIYPRIQVRSDLHDAHTYILKHWVLDYIKQNRTRSSFRSELLPYLVKKQFSKPRNTTAASISQLPDSSGDLKEDFVKDVASYMNSDDDKIQINDLTLCTQKSQDNISCHGLIYDEGVCFSINNLSSYIEANRYMCKPDSIFYDVLPRVHQSCQLAEKVQVGTDSMVGERTQINEKCSIKRSVIGKDCEIGTLVRISNCVVMDRVKISDGVNIQGCVICEGAIIGEKSELKDCFIGYQKIVEPASKLSKESLVESSAMMEI